ncbi:hypothetical protein DH2020_022765 [Rehmannia glutinosa]|uniref:Uncharacterized protein n=1 Tax=Rehmannia glutinosa TaxID=99300 RepID=A0ABR0W4Y9_REHGL
MSPISGDGGAPLPLLMVVEYLESTMSKDLLCKFPDNSAFDFDYSQSSIWSPLLPRPPPNSAAAAGLELSRRLSYGEADGVGLLENTKKMAARIKRKFTDTVLENIGRCGKMKRRRRKSFSFSPAGSGRRLSSSSPSPKTWAKVMKVAAKHFKKRKNKNKDNHNVHLQISCEF